MVLYSTCAVWYCTVHVLYGIVQYMCCMVLYSTCAVWYCTVHVLYGIVQYMYCTIPYSTCTVQYHTVHVLYGIVQYMCCMVLYSTCAVWYCTVYGIVQYMYCMKNNLDVAGQRKTIVRKAAQFITQPLFLFFTKAFSPLTLQVKYGGIKKERKKER